MRQLQGLDNEFGVGIHLLKLLLEHNHGNVKNRLGVEAWSSGGKSSLDIEAERQT